MQNNQGWPDAISLDPEGGLASPTFEELLRALSSTPVLLLAVGPQAQRGGWSARAAIAIAEAVAASAPRVILADLSLDRPELHDAVGIDNNEGLTDVFLFGASLEHVTHMLPVNSFELIPAAPFTPDAEEVLTHRRWGVLFEDYAASATRLLLYLPVSVDGSGAFSDRVGHTVVLADPQELESVRSALSVDAEIMAVVTPPVPEADELEAEDDVATAVPQREPERTAPRVADDDFAKIRIPKDSAREALIADLRKRQRAALMAPPAAIVQPVAGEVDVAPSKTAPAPRASMGFPPPRATIQEPTFATRTRPKKRKPARFILPLLVILVVSSAAAGWHYWGNQAWADWRSRRATVNAPNGATPNQRAGANAAAPSTEAPAPPAKPEGQPMPYSVSIAGYAVLDQANEMVAYLRRSEPELSFYVSPAVVQGTLFYRVFAGPLPDSAAAAAMRDTLMAKRLKTISVPSDLVSAPLAFLLGTYVRYADADIKSREIASKGIPTYIVPIGSATGTQYNLYAGAYAGPGDAGFMRDILRRESLPDTLVERTGSIRS